MTTLTIQLPDSEAGVIAEISKIVKNVKGSHIDIENHDDGFTEEEFKSLTISVNEAVMIKKGELKPLSMNDLWDE